MKLLDADQRPVHQWRFSADPANPAVPDKQR
jgi:hypothetical protein